MNASAVLISGFGAPARTATPTSTCARSTFVPAMILPFFIRLPKPSLDMITTSAGTPRRSCAPIVSGPFPCDAPDPVVTLMPVERSNSGRTEWYGGEKPPEMMTLTCATANAGHASANASDTTPVGASDRRVFFMSNHSFDRKENTTRSSDSVTQLHLEISACPLWVVSGPFVQF